MVPVNVELGQVGKRRKRREVAYLVRPSEVRLVREEIGEISLIWFS